MIVGSSQPIMEKQFSPLPPSCERTLTATSKLSESKKIASFIADLKLALEYANSDLINLSLIEWRQLTSSEKDLLSAKTVEFLTTLNALPEKQKFIFAEENFFLVEDNLSS